MKIVAISDIHGYLPNDLPEGDVLCIAGDILPLYIQRNISESVFWFLNDFKPWAEALPYKKVIFVAGNHDFMFWECGPVVERTDKELMKMLLKKKAKDTKLVYLQDSSYEFEGKLFYGSPWIEDLKAWAFYASPENLKKKWANIPENCDVLITHMPPKIGNCGAVLQAGWNYGRDFGSKNLADAIMTKNIKYHVFGHVHSGQHEETMCGGTLVNVSLKDENYEVNYKPYVFELI